MPSDNPFAPLPVTPPGALLAGSYALADRGPRFWAKLIDNLVVQAGAWLVVLSAMVLGRMDQKQEGLVFGLAALLCLPVLVYQAWLLSTTGQTIGKRVLGIRVVDVETGGPPGFWRGVCLRHCLAFLVNLLLCGAGQIYYMVDPLFIFRDDRRCLHDLLARTRVVRAA